MRFLVDNSMSPRLATALRATAHDAVHVRDLGMADASDEAIFARASAEERVVIAQDTDFGTILAIGGAHHPSVLLFRCQAKSTEAVLRLLFANLPSIQADLDAESIVVVEDTRVRVRRLPVHGRRSE